jgi:HPt (histidine-containing phosphotransfer) domain-containing protein
VKAHRYQSGFRSLQVDVIDDLRSAVGDEGGAFIAQLVAVYRIQAGQALDDMRRAAGAPDHSELRQMAHALRGSTLALGGASLGALCAQLEQPDASDADRKTIMAAMSHESRAMLRELDLYLADRLIQAQET